LAELLPLRIGVVGTEAKELAQEAGPVKVLTGHTESVNSVALSADGRWALSGSDDKTVRLWDVAKGECVRVFQGHSEEVTSDGTTLKFTVKDFSTTQDMGVAFLEKQMYLAEPFYCFIS